MSALPPEAACPLCRELLRDPVSIPCGHHFCRACIERCWQQPRPRFCCPRCGDAAADRNLRPSPELARLLELARSLARVDEEDEGEDEEGEGEEGCRKHREPLEFFCEEDAALLCAIGRESRAHRGHRVRALPEALRERREQIQAELQTLEEERDKLLGLREAEMRRNWENLERTGAERQRLLSTFQDLRQVLEELSRHLLARLGHLESEMGTEQEEKVTKLTQEISRVENRLQELQERCQRPARTFLQVMEPPGSGGDLPGPSCSPGKENPGPAPEPEMKIREFREEFEPLEETLRRVRDMLMFELPEKMTVTLDPSTAHPQLRVAPDGLSVTWERSRDHPQDGSGTGDGSGTDTGTDGTGTDPSVLGLQGVTAGRRCWDVRVSPEGSWALGVTLETPRDGAEPPELRLWSVGRCQGQFWALSSLERIPVFPAGVPGRVRVVLDWEKGGVEFFDGERRSSIFAFPAGSFGGRRVRPWFLVWGEGSGIALCP